MRRTTWLAILAGVSLVAAAPAAAQTVTVPDAEDTISDAVDTVTSTAGEVTSTADETGGGATGSADSSETSALTGGSSSGGTATGGSVLGATSTSSGSTSGTTSGSGTSSGTSSTSSTSSGSGGAERGSSPRAGRYRSAFDRLPRRIETLFERIELGQNTRANLRRLRQFLASASPAVRARILRALRAEVRRLRADGVTRTERSRIERLQLVRRALTRTAARAAAASAASDGSPLVGPAAARATRDALSARARPQERAGGAVLGTQATGRASKTAADPLPSPPLPVPDGPGDFPFVLGLLILALVALGFAAIVAAVTSHVVARGRSS